MAPASTRWRRTASAPMRQLSRAGPEACPDSPVAARKSRRGESDSLSVFYALAFHPTLLADFNLAVRQRLDGQAWRQIPLDQIHIRPRCRLIPRRARRQVVGRQGIGDQFETDAQRSRLAQSFSREVLAGGPAAH